MSGVFVSILATARLKSAPNGDEPKTLATPMLQRDKLTIKCKKDSKPSNLISAISVYQNEQDGEDSRYDEV
ncbi:hypothetical protein BOTCAL_0185g00040 [Botryotinia calthae]|uniref:Uncharacterized protein n=1 Tax=Botryotinia calthae TaxID=38488 RepID=A0A4Y8D062_9HELO|nr:hypothetical protein BOTCAL_0185g00040 [Botryotinia calthae]